MFANVFGAPVRIPRANLSLVFFFSNAIVKKKKKIFVLLARSKSNSIENIISKALKDAEISHENSTITIN